MRLIDADELLEDVRQNSQSYWADDFAYEWVNRQPTVYAVPVEMIKSRIKDLKAMLMNIDEDEHDEIWHLRTEIQTLIELLEAWAERKEE